MNTRNALALLAILVAVGCSAGPDETPRPAMTVAAYEAQCPSGGAHVTGACRINHNDGRTLRVALWGGEGMLDWLFATVPVDSDLGRYILQLLGDGGSRRLVLTVVPVRRGGSTVHVIVAAGPAKDRPQDGVGKPTP